MSKDSLITKFIHSIIYKGFAHTVIKVFNHPFMRHPIQFTITKRQLEYITRSSSNEERFTKIFTKRYWGDEESVSGFGSRLEYTANLRLRLPELMKKFSVVSIFDAPCGDFYWIKSVLGPETVYLGGDIVKPLVEKNRSMYQNEKIDFIQFDIITGKFPKSDLWICRDCLFHLSYAETFQALQQFCDSEIPYILTTTHKNDGGFMNFDIETGDFRFIDLFSAPYCFDKNVLYRIDDYIEPYPPREMCLWSREQIVRSLSKSRFSPSEGT